MRQLRRMTAGIGAAMLAAAAVVAAPAAHAAPAAVPPPGCEAGCEQAFSLPLPDNVRFEGWRHTAGGGSYSVLAYYIGDHLQDVTQLPEFEHNGVLSGACGYDGDAQRCAVTYFTGAHSEGASSMLLTADRGIEITADVLGGAPGATLRDLDGNGRPDIVLRQSTYDPSYAEAPQYWETYLESEGKLTRTGCTAPQHEETPVPSTPAQAPCYR